MLCTSVNGNLDIQPFTKALAAVLAVMLGDRDGFCPSCEMINTTLVGSESHETVEVDQLCQRGCDQIGHLVW